MLVVITLMVCAITDENYLKTNFIHYVSPVSSFVFVFSNNMLLAVIYKRGGVIKTMDSKQKKISITCIFFWKLNFSLAVWFFS